LLLPSCCHLTIVAAITAAAAAVAVSATTAFAAARAAAIVAAEWLASYSPVVFKCACQHYITMYMSGCWLGGSTHHMGFLLLILMQTFTPGGQGWPSLKKPSNAGKPLKRVVGRLPLHRGIKLEAALAATKSALLV
jgi:hypothetical protein